MTLLAHDLTQIRARNRANLKAADPLNIDSQTQDIKALLEYIDEIEEELSNLEDGS
jgi:hypothetical protein